MIASKLTRLAHLFEYRTFIIDQTALNGAIRIHKKRKVTWWAPT